MSLFLIKLLLIEFIVLMAVCIAERHWTWALYYLGASTIQLAVVWGMK